jgi:hypothetical protein
MTKYFLIKMKEGSPSRIGRPVSGGAEETLMGKETNKKVDALQKSIHTMMQIQQSKFAFLEEKVNSIEAHIIDNKKMIESDSTLTKRGIASLRPLPLPGQLSFRDD